MSAEGAAVPRQQGKKADRDIACCGSQAGEVALRERQPRVGKPRIGLVATPLAALALLALGDDLLHRPRTVQAPSDSTQVQVNFMSVPSWEKQPDHDVSLEENWLFRLRRERFLSRRSGKAHDFYIMHLADAVHVIALTPENRVILVKQFRAGSQRDSLEPPGGLLEPGEDPRVAGARELLEETGYAGAPAELLGTAWSNPSILSSRIHTVLVRGAHRVAEKDLDPNEEVEVELVAAGRLPGMLARGEIDHALAVLGVYQFLCSQIPDTPLSHVGPRSRGGTVGNIMSVVAVCAAVLATARGMGRTIEGLIAGILLFPACLYLVFRTIDPPSRAILLRGRRRSPGYFAIRILAALAFLALAFLGLLALNSVLGRAR